MPDKVRRLRLTLSYKSIPQVNRKINRIIIADFNAFGFQQSALHILPAECEFRFRPASFSVQCSFVRLFIRTGA